MPADAVSKLFRPSMPGGRRFPAAPAGSHVEPATEDLLPAWRCQVAYSI